MHLWALFTRLKCQLKINCADLAARKTLAITAFFAPSSIWEPKTLCGVKILTLRLYIHESLIQTAGALI